MHVLWQIIRSEFISNVLTSRFMIGLLVALLATGIAVLVQVDDYEKRLTAYNTAMQEAQVEARQWDVYGTITLKAHRKPNPLSIFNAGMENFGANTVSVEPSTPIFEMSSVLDGPAQKRGSDNPFLVMFLTVDLNFVFKMLLSLLAILFAYNTISGEREDGTLKLVLSNAIPRDTLVLGKYLGGMLSLLPILVVSLMVSFLIAYLSPATAFDGKDIAHIVLIFAVSLLYVSTWYLLGLLFSVWTREAATTLIFSMFVWVILTSVHSNLITFAVSEFSPYTSQQEEQALQQVTQLWDAFEKERNAYIKQRGYGSLQRSISWSNNARSVGAHFTSGRTRWSFKENYRVNSINHADTSIFQEILGYQEKLRVRYADKAEEILQGPAAVREQNMQFADNLSRLSFADVYSFTVGAIAGADRASYRKFMSDVTNYRHQIVDYLKDEKAFSSRQWFSTDQGKADFTGMPVFKHRRSSLAESFSRAQSDIFILVAWNLILFMLAYISFLRYNLS